MDKHLANNIPDITVVEKKRVWIIDVAIPGDGRIEEKELEKISKYHGLKIEIERLWEKQATVVPVVIGSLGAIRRDLMKHLRMIGLESISSSQLQKTVLLGQHISYASTSEIPRSSERIQTKEDPKITPV